MKVGFIGLGNMGRGMAGCIKAAGFEMIISDLRKEAAAPFLGNGVAWADTPREVAEQADVVFTSLPKPTDVLAVAHGANGLAAGLRKGAAWFDLSTNSLEVTKQLHQELAAQDVSFLDAPVSGGVTGAASGKLAIWVGGDKAMYDRYKPVLDAMADRLGYIGGIGAGVIAKMVHNAASAGINQVVAECLAMGIKAGLEPLPLFEAIRGGGTGKARSFDAISKRWMTGKLDPASFELQLLQKDVKLAVELGEQVGAPTPFCDMALKNLTEGVDRGWARRDQQAVHEIQRERAGVAPFVIPEADLDEVCKRT